MSVNKSLHTQGTKFNRGTGSPLVYTMIAGIVDAQPPGKKRKALDTTTLDQSDNYKQVVGSVLVENEPVELELLFDPASTAQQLLSADLESADPVAYQVALRNGETYSFLGVVTTWKPSGKMDDLYKVKVTIEISGAVTRVAGT